MLLVKITLMNSSGESVASNTAKMFSYKFQQTIEDLCIEFSKEIREDGFKIVIEGVKVTT